MGPKGAASNIIGLSPDGELLDLSDEGKHVVVLRLVRPIWQRDWRRIGTVSPSLENVLLVRDVVFGIRGLECDLLVWADDPVDASVVC